MSDLQPQEGPAGEINLGAFAFSPKLDLIAGALVKAQSQFSKAEKSATGRVGKTLTKYADLDDVFQACREALFENKIAIVQSPSGSGISGEVGMYTLLLHSSGQWIAGTLTMKPESLTPQAYGSCITYARRYALEAMLGLTRKDADDDGHAASSKTPPPMFGMPGPGHGAPAPGAGTTGGGIGFGLHQPPQLNWPGGVVWGSAYFGGGDQRVQALRLERTFNVATLCSAAGINEEQFLQVLAAQFYTQDIAALTAEQYAQIEARLRARIPPRR